MNSKFEFNEIVADIIKNDVFKNLENEAHHGITRLDHSLNVARVTYFFAKKAKMKNYKLITRAALLHDLFTDDEVNGKLSLVTHPSVAADNAKKEFQVTDLEYSMIKSHMFPLSVNLPKNKESVLLLTTDKIVATYEMLKYKLPLYSGMCYFLLFNLFLKK